jgi:hypothetical protein
LEELPGQFFYSAPAGVYEKLPKLDLINETKRFSKSRNRSNYRKWD